MPRFEVVSPYQPTGDQPEAVEKLAQRLEKEEKRDAEG